jgi:hypothetical protein
VTYHCLLSPACKSFIPVHLEIGTSHGNIHYFSACLSSLSDMIRTHSIVPNFSILFLSRSPQVSNGFIGISDIGQLSWSFAAMYSIFAGEASVLLSYTPLHR